MRRGALAGCAVAVALAGCATEGSEDKPGESAVRLQVETYLRALADGNGKRACSKLTRTYRDAIAQSDPKLKQLGITDCAEFIKELVAPPPLEFDGQNYDGDSIDDLDLEITVEGSTATVTGSAGKQRYRLVQSGGEGWRIDSIEPVRSG